jgi:hypothetical protein
MTSEHELKMGRSWRTRKISVLRASSGLKKKTSPEGEESKK